MEAYRFEPLAEDHRRAVIDIFNYYVTETTAAYRRDPVGYDFFENFTGDMDRYPAYAIRTEDGVVAGFCMLEPFMNAPTFDAVAEATYFLHPEHTGRGIGSLALGRLEADAKKMGITRLVANASSENDGSVRFHLGRGFTEYGRLENAGEKLGRIFGIVYLEKKI